MSEQNGASLEATPEQVLYANVLNKGMLIGLLILFITFAIYVFGIMDPYLPLDELSNFWGLKVQDFLHQAKIPAGWGWTGLLQYGDFLNFTGIVFLSAVTIFCYLAIIPTLLRNNDKLYALLAFLEVLVLTLAASGILSMGGH